MRRNEGKQLGKYRLLCELGRGGMAAVHLALASGPAGFHKLLVLKVILPELAGEPEFVGMFLDEARLAARLNHPNVVQTNEVGCEDDRYFIAMEYLEGQTMQRVLTRLGFGKNPHFTRGMQVRLLCDALVGLHHAHELADFDGSPLGVVHRDVSPHNVFVTYAGQVKVLDFGIAKAMSSTNHTVTGTLKGKVGYMAPEQAKGDRVDRRADVYSAGVMLWEILVGQRLFKGVPDVQVLQRLGSNQIPRPSEVDPDVDPELEAIVIKAMAFRPEDRFASAAEFGEALEEYLRARGATVTSRDVGLLVASEFGEERKGMRALVEQQLAEVSRVGLEVLAPARASIPDASSAPRAVPALDVAPSTAAVASPAPPPRVSVPSLPSPLDAPSGELPPPPSSAATVVEGARARSIEIPSLPPPRRLPLAAVVVAVLGIASLAVAALVLLGRGAPTGEGAAPSATSDVARDPVLSVTLASQPAGAKVRCRGELVGTTPLPLEVRRGAPLPCAYVLDLEGHEPHAVEPRPVTGELPVVELRPLDGAVAASAGTTAPALPRVPVLPAKAKATAAPATAAPATLPPDIRLKR